MNKEISIKSVLTCILFGSAVFVVSSCGSLHSKKESDNKPGSHVDSPKEVEGQTSLDIKDVLSKSVSTISISKDGDFYLLTPDGKVVDPKLLKSSPNYISSGEVVNFQTISIFATKGSPIEVRQNLGSMIICYVIDDVSWTYLGGCPREQYMRR